MCPHLLHRLSDLLLSQHAFNVVVLSSLLTIKNSLDRLRPILENVNKLTEKQQK